MIEAKLRRPYTPYGAARKLWGCRDEEILIEGPAGTGKSRAVLEKINFQMMKYPGARALITRKTRESMTQSVLVTFEDDVLPAGSPVLGTGIQRRLRSEYTYPNGSKIVVGGLDDPNKIMSTEYDTIAIFEGTEAAEEDLEKLTTRLGRKNAIPYQQLMVDVNPGPPSHWLNQRALKGKMTRLLSRHRDNPILFDQKLGEFTEVGKKYLARLDRLSGVRRVRLLEGKWVASDGMVYPAWDESIHVIDEMPKAWDSWRKVRSIDFGFNNPFVCLWGAIDPDDDIYIYREIYHSQRIVKQHATGVKDVDGQLVSPGIVQLSIGENIEATVADHDREDRATLESEGVDSTPAYKDIETGIEAVKDRLTPSLHSDGSKRPRVYFLRDALVERDDELFEQGLPTQTTAEFDGYSYVKPKEGKSPKEEPLDKDNHGMDALRYLVAYVDNLSGSVVDITAEEPVSVL